MNLELLIESITAVLRISFKILNLIHSNHSVSDNAGHYSHQRNYSLSSRGRGCMAPVKLAIELFVRLPPVNRIREICGAQLK